MQRQKVITSFFENIGTLKRLMRSARPKSGSTLSNITPAQMGIMFTLAQEGPKSIKELSEILCMSSSAATQLVDTLVDEKLLARSENQIDRRKISVALTKAGKRKLIIARKHHFAALTRLLTPLTDSEVNELYRLEQKIIAYLK